MEMEYRCLDLTLVSAEGLKDVNFFSKMDVYVVVQLLGYANGKNKKRTHIDRNGGTNPKWNHRIKFTIDEPSLRNNPALALLFQLKSERTFGSDRDIGEVTIPMQELYGNWAGANDVSERVVEYQVKTSSGKARGTLKISYKFGENVKHQPEAKNMGTNQPVTAFPAGAPAPQVETSMSYAPYPGMGYAAYQQPYPGYAPPGYGGYPAPHGYPPAAPSYGYAPPPGYGYPQPMQQVQQPKKKKGKMGMGAGLGLGLGAGLLGGMLVGDMVSDVGEMAAYADGYGDAMGDGGFDF